MYRLMESAEAVFHGTSWRRPLLVPAVLALLVAGCDDSDNDKVDRAVSLHQEIVKYTAEKGAPAGSSDVAWSGPTWVVVEGEASQLAQAPAANASWKLTNPADATKEIIVLETRMSSETPTTAWLLVSGTDARLIDSASASIPWRLVTGTGTPGLVRVRGYYARNGSEFRPHLVVQSGVTGAGASVVANAAKAKSLPPRRNNTGAPAGAANLNKPSFNPSGTGPGNFGRPAGGPGTGGNTSAFSGGRK